MTKFYSWLASISYSMTAIVKRMPKNTHIKIKQVPLNHKKNKERKKYPPKSDFFFTLVKMWTK